MTKSAKDIHHAYIEAVRAGAPRCVAIPQPDADAYYMVGFFTAELLALASKFPAVAAELEAKIPVIAKMQPGVH